MVILQRIRQDFSNFPIHVYIRTDRYAILKDTCSRSSRRSRLSRALFRKRDKSLKVDGIDVDMVLAVHADVLMCHSLVAARVTSRRLPNGRSFVRPRKSSSIRIRRSRESCHYVQPNRPELLGFKKAEEFQAG